MVASTARRTGPLQGGRVAANAERQQLLQQAALTGKGRHRGDEPIDDARHVVSRTTWSNRAPHHPRERTVRWMSTRS